MKKIKIEKIKKIKIDKIKIDLIKFIKGPILLFFDDYIKKSN